MNVVTESIMPIGLGSGIWCVGGTPSVVSQRQFRLESLFERTLRLCSARLYWDRFMPTTSHVWLRDPPIGTFAILRATGPWAFYGTVPALRASLYLARANISLGPDR